MEQHEPFKIVGRMAGLRPEMTHGFEMHRKRRGGDCGHVDSARTALNRVLHGPQDWASQTLARIDAIRDGNQALRLRALTRRKRRKDLLAAVSEGPADPWRPTKVGPMREMVLTAHHAFFGATEPGELTALEAAFEERAMDWLRDTFGDALIHARADRDEKAYHIHAVLMPLDTKKDGRVMLEPSAHPLIKDYELFQDAIGEAFASLGLARGEKRAEAIRAARQALAEGRDVTIPLPRRHVSPRSWRESEERRIAKEKQELGARMAAQDADISARQSQISADAARLAEQAALQWAADEELYQRTALLDAREKAVAEESRDQARRALAVQQAERRLMAGRKELLTQQAEHAAERDAFAIGAEAIAQGLLTPDDDPAGLATNTATAGIVERLARAPSAWRRLADTLRPAWARLREQARSEAEKAIRAERARIQRDRAEIESTWEKFGTLLRGIAPRLSPAAQSTREAVERAISKWRALDARDQQRNPQRDQSDPNDR